MLCLSDASNTWTLKSVLSQILMEGGNMSSFTINKDLKLVIGGFFALTLAACGQEDSSPMPAAQTSAPIEEAGREMREGEVPVDIQ